MTYLQQNCHLRLVSPNMDIGAHPLPFIKWEKHMEFRNKFALAAALTVMGAFVSTSVAAETTLEIVKERGHLRCQVGSPSPGFYNMDSEGNWYGLDVSVCQAVAAAIFGDKDAIEFQSVSSQARFTALANGDSDMLSRTATMTMSRETQLGVDFLPPVFYDGQGFMVRADSGITSALELKGASICVKTGSTTELNLTDFSRDQGLNVTPVTFEDYNVRDDTYQHGGCDAVSNDKSSLAGNAASFQVPSDHIILPETISKEPLAPAVRQGDSQWHDLVQWSIFALINAEELGITQANVDDMRSNSTDPNVLRMLGAEGNLHEGLGLDNDWAYNIIKQVGNYGEIYEKYIGNGEQGLGIAREGTLNALWTNGGLMYSPPMR